MGSEEPITELDPRFSSESAQATAWEEARALVAAAEVFWLSTVRADDRPHEEPRAQPPVHPRHRPQRDSVKASTSWSRATP